MYSSSYNTFVIIFHHQFHQVTTLLSGKFVKKLIKLMFFTYFETRCNHPVGMMPPHIKKFYFKINKLELGENKLRNR